MTDLLVSTNSKKEIYNLILVIINALVKIIHYEAAKVIIIGFGIAKVIIDVVV